MIASHIPNCPLKSRINLLVVFFILASGLRAPEVIAFINNKFNIPPEYLVYSLKTITIFIFISLFYIGNIVTAPILSVNSVFIFMYGLLEFNGAISTDELIRAVPSFVFVVTSLLTAVILAQRSIHNDDFYVNLGIPLLISGTAIYCANFLGDNAGFLDVNLFMLLGILLMISKSTRISLLACLFFLIASTLTNNRTGCAIAILIACCYFWSNLFAFGMVKILFASFISIGVFVFFLEESNYLWANAVLTGRISIWDFWLNVVFSDFESFFWGIGFRNENFKYFGVLGGLINGAGFYFSPHSSFISMVVRGGFCLTFCCMVYFIFLLRDISFSLKGSLSFYSLVLYLSFNSMTDYIYPDLAGLTLAMVIVWESSKAGLVVKPPHIFSD